MIKLMISSLLLLICTQNIAFAELHDPTRPAKYVDAETGKINTGNMDLDLTLVSVDRQVAVINGMTLKVGESIEGQRVLAVESDSVRLAGSGGTITTLFLLDKSVKKAAQ